MEQPYFDPQPFYLLNTKNLLSFKTLPGLPILHELLFTSGNPSGQLAKTMPGILYLPQWECAVCCVSTATTTRKSHRYEKAQLWGGGKPSTGVTVLNVVHFFMMWCLYLIYLLCVFCNLSRHVLWKSSSLNVKLIAVIYLLSLRLEENEWCS